ncbi:MAG TPA: hypothetical protein VFW38_08965 [Solirubrobacteraceae bacterium]|nr:hypothetical protein [Solirubrobacteraceae bacterium]
MKRRLVPFGVGAIIAAVLALAVPATPAGAVPAPAFGIAHFSMQALGSGEAGDELFTQAAGHPFALKASVEFANEPAGAYRVPTEEARDVTIDLPPGLLAYPQAVAACRQVEQQCPVDSQVGYFVLHASTLSLFAGSEQGVSSLSLLAPIYNLAPSGSEPAELGLATPLGTIPMQGRLVRTPAGYSLAVSAKGLAQLGVLSIEITLWGAPAETAHDAQRGLTCVGPEANPTSLCTGGGTADGEEARPFLTMPSKCGAPAPTASVWADAWLHPAEYVKAESSLASLGYCDRLPFSPQLSVLPENLAAEQPVGVDVGVGVSSNEAPSLVSAPPLRSVALTLPQGMSINPAAAGGVTACAAAGSEGIDLPSGLGEEGRPLSPSEVGEGEESDPGGEAVLAAGHCPRASTIGQAEARSPLLAEPIAGHVYLAEPLCGSSGQAPCGEGDAADGRLLRFYVELGGRGEQSSHGVVIKLTGAIQVNPANGQLVVVLSEAPQLPLSKLELRLFGGQRALLVNPSQCGPATTNAELQPWGSPYAPEAASSSYYNVAGCSQPQPFQPTLTAGSYSVAAGQFTPFLFDLQRKSGEQTLSGLQLQAPQGLVAVLAGITPCQEAAAGAGACPQSARVGSSAVALGSGTEPLWLDGSVYLTGPYRGAPFGLAIVTSARVGPLDLGQVVIRARLDVNPTTGALTVTSDSLPQILLGVPLHMSELRLDLDRPGFIANPTSCAGQRVLANVSGGGGAGAKMSNPFGLAGCRALGFAPKLSAFTSAAASIRSGASLDLRLSQAAGPGSGQANLARLRIALPRALPTRLTALQSACRAAVFAADPAACPAASLVGIARAATPLISGQLAGPVYLIAHGRGQPPSPTIVLQGQGLRLDLSAGTTIERSGRTAIGFGSLPDLPLRSVELYLPRGPHSVLAPAGKLCSAATAAHTLALPVELAAHNGLVLHRTAAIAVRGCPPAPRHKKRRRRLA